MNGLVGLGSDDELSGSPIPSASPISSELHVLKDPKNYLPLIITLIVLWLALAAVLLKRTRQNSLHKNLGTPPALIPSFHDFIYSCANLSITPSGKIPVAYKFDAQTATAIREIEDELAAYPTAITFSNGHVLHLRRVSAETTENPLHTA